MIVKKDILRYIEDLSKMRHSLGDLNDLLDLQDSNSILNKGEFQKIINSLMLKIEELSDEFNNLYSKDVLNDGPGELIDEGSLNDDLMIEIEELSTGFCKLNKNINELDDMLKVVSNKNNFEINLLKDEISKKDFHIKKLYNKLNSFNPNSINLKINRINVDSPTELGIDLNLTQFNIKMKITPNEPNHAIAWANLGESTSKAYIVGLVFDKPSWGILVINGGKSEYYLPNQPLNLNKETIFDVIYDNGYWVFNIGDNVFSFFDDSIKIEKIFGLSVNNATLDFILF